MRDAGFYWVLTAKGWEPACWDTDEYDGSGWWWVVLQDEDGYDDSHWLRIGDRIVPPEPLL